MKFSSKNIQNKIDIQYWSRHIKKSQEKNIYTYEKIKLEIGKSTFNFFFYIANISELQCIQKKIPLAI